MRASGLGAGLKQANPREAVLAARARALSRAVAPRAWRGALPLSHAVEASFCQKSSIAASPPPRPVPPSPMAVLGFHECHGGSLGTRMELAPRLHTATATLWAGAAFCANARAVQRCCGTALPCEQPSISTVA